MSEKDEITLRELLVTHIQDSIEWRRKSDELINKAYDMIEDSNKLTITSHDLIRSELGVLINTVDRIETTTKAHSIDIEFVNDLKKKAGWTWNTAKGIATISSWGIGVAWAVSIGYQYVKDFFSHFKS